MWSVWEVDWDRFMYPGLNGQAIICDMRYPINFTGDYVIVSRAKRYSSPFITRTKRTAQDQNSLLCLQKVLIP